MFWKNLHSLVQSTIFEICLETFGTLFLLVLVYVWTVLLYVYVNG